MTDAYSRLRTLTETPGSLVGADIKVLLDEVDRLRAILNEHKRIAREGPFPHRKQYRGGRLNVLVHERDQAAAAERARIAAAIRAAGHPDGYHRVDTTREWAGIYCADCAVTERSARVAETAPEEGQ